MKKAVSKYIKARGREVILQECGYNLRAVKNHLKRHCTSSNWNSVISNFKQDLKDNRLFDKALMNEFLDIVKKYFGGLKNGK